MIERTTPLLTWRERIPPSLKLQEGLGLIVILALILIVMSWLSPVFFTGRNLINLLVDSSTISMIAVFTTMLMVSGGLDLSVAANAALAGVVIAEAQPSLGIWGASVLAVVVAALVGTLNGFMVTIVRINPFITTLGTMSLARGLAFVLADGLTVPVYEAGFAQLGEGTIVGVPLPVIITLGLFLVSWMVMRYTVYGRAMYAIGGNAEASNLAGLPVNRYRFAAYLLCGLSAGVAGVFLTSRLYAAAPQAAQGIELSVIAAVVLGGTSLAGGKGTILGTFFGVLILATLNNGMRLLSLSTDYQQIIQGAVLLLAVGLDQLRIGGTGRLMRADSGKGRVG
jgi:ribose transport system permease protein